MCYGAEEGKLGGGGGMKQIIKHILNIYIYFLTVYVMCHVMFIFVQGCGGK